MQLFDINSSLYTALLIINTVIYILGHKQYKEIWLLKFGVYLLTTICTYLVSTILTLNSLSNIESYHFCNFAQIIALSIFYKEIIGNKGISKGINYSLTISLLIIILQYIIWPEKLHTFNALEVFLLNYLIIICGLIYSYRNLALKPKYNIANIGVITFSFISISILTYGHYLVQIEIERAIRIWILNDYNILFHQIMILAQYIQFKRSGRGELQ